MANLYKKAAERQKIVPGGAKPEPEVKDDEVVVPAAEETPAPVTEVADEKSIRIPLEEIGASKKPKKKSTTLYLSEEVIAELKARGAKAGGMSSSEYLDELLKRVFEL